MIYNDDQMVEFAERNETSNIDYDEHATWRLPCGADYDCGCEDHYIYETRCLSCARPIDSEPDALCSDLCRAREAWCDSLDLERSADMNDYFDGKTDVRPPNIYPTEYLYPVRWN